MCHGGRLLADFWAGSNERPSVPAAVQDCVTWTADGTWMVWAHKVARAWRRNSFMPLTGGEAYAADAVAACRIQGHEAPQPGCACGFHAVSAAHAVPAVASPFGGGLVHLDVALSGRVLAFALARGDVLFRAARQTVVRVSASMPADEPAWWPPDDPDGRFALREGRQPRGAGPQRLRLPNSDPAVAEVIDDAGYCALEHAPVTRRADAVLARA